MNTEQFPNATFTLTEPIDLASAPQVNEQLTAQATGDMTIRGETNPVTFDVAVQRTADGLRVNGSIPVTFADYGIDPPNFGGISVEDTPLIGVHCHEQRPHVANSRRPARDGDRRGHRRMRARARARRTRAGVGAVGSSFRPDGR